MYHSAPAPGVPGTYDLQIAFQWDVTTTPGAEAQWRNAFEWASTLLALATDGQARLGRVTWTNNMTNNQDADVWLFNDATTAATHGAKGLGTPGFHMQVGLIVLGRDVGGAWERGALGDFTHEFGHYLFNLRDEYPGTGCIEPRAAAVTAAACLMEYGGKSLLRNEDATVVWTPTSPGPAHVLFPVSNFCVFANHDPDRDTPQSMIHSDRSCWETIELDAENDLTDPVAAPAAPAATIPQRHVISWRQTTEPFRYALVLDASGSMAIDNAIDGVIFGAQFWADLEVLFRNELAVVPYATNVFNPPQRIDLKQITAANIDSTKTTIGSLNAGGMTNITAAVLEGRNQLASPGPAQRRTLILFSDGRHNQGSEITDTQLASIESQGISLYTVGYGQFVQEPLLKRIASSPTGYKWIAQPAQSDAPQAIMDALMEIAAETHSGLLTSGDFVISAEEQLEAADRPGRPYTDEDIEFVADLELDQPGRDGVHRSVLVEEGAATATFVLNHRPDDDASLYLFRPADVGGQIVHPADPDVELVDGGDAPYAFYVVTEPDPGEWRMLALRNGVGAIRGAMLAFAENEAVVVGITGTQVVHEHGAPVRVWAQISSRYVLTAVRTRVTPTMRALQPHELPEQLEFVEEESGKGSYVLELPGFSEPGSYEFLAEFEWTSDTREARDPIWDEQHGLESPDPYVPPPFRRVKRFQVQVGPLPEGEDLDGGDQKAA